MKEVNITIRVDSRFYKALAENYEGTIEGFLESELANLYDEIVPPEDAFGIQADIDAEAEDHAKEKFALICMKNDYEDFYIMSADCKTFLDVAKAFATDVYSDLHGYALYNFKSSFGDYDEINGMAFNIMRESCGKDNRISVVAIFDMKDGENLLSVQTANEPNVRLFDIDKLYHATRDTINSDCDYYLGELREFEDQLKDNEAEIHLDEQGESKDAGMQM